jgi:hypothetical protein
MCLPPEEQLTESGRRIYICARASQEVNIDVNDDESDKVVVLKFRYALQVTLHRTLEILFSTSSKATKLTTHRMSCIRYRERAKV